MKKASIIRVIKADASISGYYTASPNVESHKPGDACVIGGLYLASGGRRHHLQKVNQKAINDPKCRFIRKRLMAKFGLTEKQCVALQQINDDWTHDTAARRRDLIKLISRWK